MRLAVVALIAFGSGLAVGLAWRGDAPAPRRAARMPAEPEQAPEERRVPDLPAATIVVPRGGGVFRGNVRTLDGEPLGDVRIVATPTRPVRGGRGSTRTPAGPPDERLLRSFVDDLRWNVATRRETRTRSDGAYELAGLAPRDHSVRAYLDGYEIRRAGERRSTYRPDAVIDFVARRVVRVPVEIRPLDVPNVWLRVRGDAMTSTRSWRRGYEWIELEPGTYTVQALGGDRQEFESQPQTLTVTPDGAPGVVLDLLGKPGLKGRIALPDGYALESSVYVYCLPAESSEPPRARVFRKNGRPATVGGALAEETGDLSFLIQGLEEGAYFVGVGYGERVEGIRLVLVRGLTEIELRVPEPDLDAAVVVYAKGPDGRPLRKFGVGPSIAHPNAHVSSGDAVLRTLDGGRVVRFAKWRTEEWGRLDDRARYFVDVSAKGLGSVRREVKPGQRLDVRFREPADLTVVVEGYLKSPLRDSLTVTLKRDGKPIQWWAPLDRSTGVYERKHLQPGPLLVILDRTRDPLVEREVRLDPGDNRVTLQIPVLHRVEVIVPGATKGRVWLLRDEHGRGSRPLDRSGRAVFELPAGEHTLGYGKDRRVTVRVPGTGKVTLR